MQFYAEQLPNGEIRLLTFDFDEANGKFTLRSFPIGEKLPENAKLIPSGFRDFVRKWYKISNKKELQECRFTVLRSLTRNGEPVYLQEKDNERNEVDARTNFQARLSEAFETHLFMRAFVSTPDGQITITSNGIIFPFDVPIETLVKMLGLDEPGEEARKADAKFRASMPPKLLDCSMSPTENQAYYALLQKPDLKPAELHASLQEHTQNNFGEIDQYKTVPWLAEELKKGPESDWIKKEVIFIEDHPVRAAAALEVPPTDLALQLQATEQAMGASTKPATPDDSAAGVGVVLFAGPRDVTQPQPQSQPDGSTPKPAASATTTII